MAGAVDTARDRRSLRSLPRRQDREKEPAWHIHARKQRSSDRVTMRLAAACLRLARHHGSTLPKELKQFVSAAGDVPPHAETSSGATTDVAPDPDDIPTTALATARQAHGGDSKAGPDPAGKGG